MDALTFDDPLAEAKRLAELLTQILQRLVDQIERDDLSEEGSHDR